MKTFFRLLTVILFFCSSAFLFKQSEDPKAGPKVCAFALKHFIEIRQHERDYMLLKKNGWTEGLPSKIGNVKLEILNEDELQARAAATEILGYYSVRQEPSENGAFTINVVNHFITPDEDVESCGVKMQIAADKKEKKPELKGVQEWCN